jgi:hypothetical protein
MTTPTELRNLILETIGQLGKFVDVMSEYEEGYSDNDVKLLSFAFIRKSSEAVW